MMKWICILPFLIPSAAASAPSSLEEEVARKIEAVLPENLALVDVTLPTGTARAGTDSGTPPPDVTVIFSSAPRAGSSTVQITLRRNEGGRGEKRAWAHIRIAEKKSALIAARDLAAGEVLVPEDVSFVRVAAEPLERGANAAASEARSETRIEGDPRVVDRATVLEPIARGSILTRRTIALASPVARGTAITVISRHGSVEVFGEGTLETAARPGEQATARLVATKRSVRGRLTDAHTLLIESEVHP